MGDDEDVGGGGGVGGGALQDGLVPGPSNLGYDAVQPLRHLLGAPETGATDGVSWQASGRADVQEGVGGGARGFTVAEEATVLGRGAHSPPGQPWRQMSQAGSRPWPARRARMSARVRPS